MIPNFTPQISFMFSVTQSARKTWNYTYVKNEQARTALDKWVDSETKAVKTALNQIDKVFDSLSKNYGTFLSTALKNSVDA